MTILKNHIIVRARVVHKCDECLQLVEIGGSYREVVHTEDGFQSYKVHITCGALASIINEHRHESEEWRHLYDCGADERSEAREELARRDKHTSTNIIMKGIENAQEKTTK